MRARCELERECSRLRACRLSTHKLDEQKSQALANRLFSCCYTINAAQVDTARSLMLFMMANSRANTTIETLSLLTDADRLQKEGPVYFHENKRGANTNVADHVHTILSILHRHQTAAREPALVEDLTKRWRECQDKYAPVLEREQHEQAQAEHELLLNKKQLQAKSEAAQQQALLFPPNVRRPPPRKLEDFRKELSRDKRKIKVLANTSSFTSSPGLARRDTPEIRRAKKEKRKTRRDRQFFLKAQTGMLDDDDFEPDVLVDASRARSSTELTTTSSSSSSSSSSSAMQSSPSVSARKSSPKQEGVASPKVAKRTSSSEISARSSITTPAGASGDESSVISPRDGAPK